uniref:Ceramidase n=1 Tax=Cyanothece sp. (strain PCC 7425 / ATCC 29141) TaxID=395961 RepID=B8HUX2_CYAP4
MNEYIDLYCERTAPGLWNEPLNALSNLSFFIAAWAMWRLAGHERKLSKSVWIIIGLSGSIGVGSFLFHTFATRWANILDIIPILLFQLWFLWLYLRQVIRLKPFYAGFLVIIFYFALDFSRQLKHLLNGSLVYAPALLVLWGLGGYHYQQQKREPWVLLAAAAVFLLSLIFRTIDQRVCPDFGIGTHFLWHIFNGILLYLSARALILNCSPEPE